MNRRRWAAIAVATVVMLGGGLWWKNRGGEKSPRYRTAAVERGSIEAVVSATGTVNPVEQVEVGSQVSGTVWRIFADYNSRVRAGQVLLQIEPSSFRARVVQAQAAVAKAEVAVKDGQRIQARARELFKQDLIAKTEVEAAEVAVEQRVADLRQARAALQMAQVDLDHTVIRAPIEGVVIARAIDLGQTVAASLQAPKLFVIAKDLSRMQVETKIDEADIGRIRPGLPASFTVDAFPDFTFRGAVAQVRLEPITDQGVVTYTTVIQTGNPEQRLRPGMTANVTVQVARREDVLKVPLAALRFRPPAGAASRGRATGALAAAAPAGGEARQPAADPRGRTGRAGADRGEASDSVRGRGSGGLSPRATRLVPPPEGAAPSGSVDAYKPGVVYALQGKSPFRVPVLSGLSDGAWVEVQSDRLKPGDQVVIGTEAAARANQMTPPPGMGGPTFRGPGGGTRGGGRGGR